MTEDQLRLLARIYKTQDGRDLVEEILKPMLISNHMDLLKEGRDHRDETIGFGNCVLFLLQLFQDAEQKLEGAKVTQAPDRI